MSRSEPPRGRVGLVLSSKWKLDRVLGSGGMASVFVAEHVRNRHRVAVKLLHASVARDKDLRSRFLHEGYVANKVSHPGVVQVIDDGVDGEHVYLVMELLTGRTVKELWVDGGRTLPADRVDSLLRQALEIVAAAHAVGVVHRDLKPDNLFLTEGGELKILDFGIARIFEEQSVANHVTATGAMLGTPAFMPPEQALGHWKDVDARSDLYSLAATAWVLLTGRMVHDEKTIPQLLMAVATKQVQPIASVMPDVPAVLAAVIDRGLKFEPADRWPDATTMARALDGPPEKPTVPLAAVAAEVAAASVRLLRSTAPTTRYILDPVLADVARHGTSPDHSPAARELEAEDPPDTTRELVPEAVAAPPAPPPEEDPLAATRELQLPRISTVAEPAVWSKSDPGRTSAPGSTSVASAPSSARSLVIYGGMAGATVLAAWLAWLIVKSPDAETTTSAAPAMASQARPTPSSAPGPPPPRVEPIAPGPAVAPQAPAPDPAPMTSATVSSAVTAPSSAPSAAPPRAASAAPAAPRCVEWKEECRMELNGRVCRRACARTESPRGSPP